MASAGSRLTSSGLSSYAVPGGKIVTSLVGGGINVALKLSDGVTDPSPIAPLYCAFRSDASSGAAFEGRAIVAPLSLTVPNVKTLGTVNGVPFRLWVVLFDDSGTIRMGVINAAAGSRISLSGALTFTPDGNAFSLDETALLSSALFVSSDKAGIIYMQPTAVTSKPFRFLGSLTWNSGLAAVGTWDALPDAIQMSGANSRGPGQFVQTVWNGDPTGHVTGDHVIPFDGTTPQVTEGGRVFETPIVPTSPANYLEHEILVHFYADHTDGVALTLFQDNSSNAIATACVQVTLNIYSQISLRFRGIAGAAAPTFKVNIGNQTAGTGIIVNPAIFNNTLYSTHKITEYMG